MYIINTYSEIHKTVSYSYIHIMMHIWGYINDDVYHNKYDDDDDDDDDDAYISSYVHNDAYIYIYIYNYYYYYYYYYYYIYMDIAKYNYN